MKINSTPFFWAAFYLVSLMVLALIAYAYIEPREIVINQSQAKAIGLKIAANENTIRRENLITWDVENNLASLGIVPFIWYPQDENRSQMSFNGLMAYISKSRSLPDWLSDTVYPPWFSKDDYLSIEHDVFKARLSYFLQETIAEQIQYLAFELEVALPKMLGEVKNPFAKMHVYKNFYHISMEENGVYALLDYVIFMGKGISLDEKYNNQGWGLLQVLENMTRDSDNLMQGFVDSADLLLMRRISNAQGSEDRWLPEWRKRIQTYVPQRLRFNM